MIEVSFCKLTKPRIENATQIFSSMKTFHYRTKIAQNPKKQSKTEFEYFKNCRPRSIRLNPRIKKKTFHIWLCLLWRFEFKLANRMSISVIGLSLELVVLLRHFHCLTSSVFAICSRRSNQALFLNNPHELIVISSKEID